jgi:hypothetical protein
MLDRGGGGNPHALAHRRPVNGGRERLAGVTRTLLVAAWTLTATLVWAAAPSERVPVATLRPLLLAALAHGTAHGTLVGEAAPFMTQHFGSTAPIEIDVRTLHPLPQLGCQQLEVTTTQRAVIDPKTARAQDARLVYQISYCRNGDFPAGSNP